MTICLTLITILIVTSILRRFVIQVGACLYNQRHGTIRARERPHLTNHANVQVGEYSFFFVLCVLSLRLDRMEWLGEVLTKRLQDVKEFMLQR